MNCFVFFLEKSPSNLCGHFSCKEFQAAENSSGNKPCGNGGASLLRESKESLAKIICVEPEFDFSEEFQCLFEELLEDYLVDDIEDFNHAVPFVHKLIMRA